MKSIAIAVSVAGLTFGVAILAQTQTMTAEQELLKLEQDWSDSDLKQDWAVLDRILAEDYILTDSNGKVWTKA